MTPSKPIQTPIERRSIDRPLIELVSVRIYAERNGNTVLGRATFPYETYCRGEVPIDYHSRRPDDATDPSTPLDKNTRRHLDAVKAHKSRVANRNGTPLREIAAQVGREFDASARSIQAWVYKFETGGADALRARYSAPPPKIPAFDPKHATEAVLACACWAFRIGNVDRIDTKMMHAFVHAISVGYSAADLIATIDCYYSYPCNRDRYPFRPYAKWLKWDLTKWIFRAALNGDYRRALAEDSSERTALHAPPESLLQLAQQVDPQSDNPRSRAPDVRTHIRDTRDRSTTTAIAKLADPPSVDRRSGGNAAISTRCAGHRPDDLRPADLRRDRQGGAPIDQTRQPLTRAERQSRRDRARATAKIIGPEATRQAIASTAPGIKPLVSPLGDDDRRVPRPHARQLPRHAPRSRQRFPRPPRPGRRHHAPLVGSPPAVDQQQHRLQGLLLETRASPCDRPRAQRTP